MLDCLCSISMMHSTSLTVPPSLIHGYTWDFSIASQNFDSALNLFTFVRQDSEVADITLLLIVGGRAVLF